MWVSLTAMGVAVAMTPSLPVEPLTVTTANSPTKTSTSLHTATVRGCITCSLACSESTMNKCVIGHLVNITRVSLVLMSCHMDQLSMSVHISELTTVVHVTVSLPY